MITLKMKIVSSRWGEALESKREAVSQIVRSTAFAIEADAKSRAPVDTGFLRNSIKATIEQGEIVAKVVVGADYGRFVEYGTRRAGAQPFLRPAVEVNKPLYFAALRKVLHSR